MRAIWGLLVRLVAGVEVAVAGVVTGGLRSVLTVLGVTIGVASVVSLLAVGQGARVAIAAQYQSLGTNVITIQSHSPLVRLTAQVAADLAARVPFVTAAMPVVAVSDPVRWRAGSSGGSGPVVLGVTPALLQIRRESVTEGSFITPLEQQDALHVAVVGYTAAHNLFGGLDPVNQDIYIGQAEFRVVGVLAYQGGASIGTGSVPVLSGGGSSSTASGSGTDSGSGTGAAQGNGTGAPSAGAGSGTGASVQQTVAVGSGIDDAVLIPESAAEWLDSNTQVSAIWMKANNRAAVQPAVLQTERILQFQFHLTAGSSAPGPAPGPKAFPGQLGGCFGPSCGGGNSGGQVVLPGGGGSAVSVQSLDALVHQADAANSVLTLMLTAIAGVSLLVGGIGVMNIMLVSVRERTVEIGLRKALGALQLDLLYQFVVEALVLCALGGVCGWLAGYGGIQLLHRYGVQAVALPGAFGVALIAAVGVGVLFGAYPAYLASELEPVEALRRQ